MENIENKQKEAQLIQDKPVITMETSFMTVLAGVLIAAFPILAPYSIGGISLNWMLGLLFIFCRICKYKSISIPHITMPMVAYTFISIILSINGFLVLSNLNNLINAEIAAVLDLLIYITLWTHSDIKITMKYATRFGYICCGYAFFQIIMSITGNKIPLGQLPIFDVSTGWVNDVWGFRFNSLFSEPSYFAIYLLPIFLYNFLNKSWLNAILFGVFILLSSSSLGIISLCLVIIFQFFKNNWSLKNKIKFVAILALVFCGLQMLTANVSAFESFITRSIEKISDIFKNSSNGGFNNDVRLSGYIRLFGELPIKEQIFGVGNAQLQNFFAERGVRIYNYSNSFVLSLLNFGLIGFLTFLCFLGSTFYKSYKNKTVLFFLILVIAFAVDSLLFSYRYYWLLYFVFFANQKTEAE